MPLLSAVRRARAAVRGEVQFRTAGEIRIDNIVCGTGWRSDVKQYMVGGDSSRQDDGPVERDLATGRYVEYHTIARAASNRQTVLALKPPSVAVKTLFPLVSFDPDPDRATTCSGN